MGRITCWLVIAVGLASLPAWVGGFPLRPLAAQTPTAFTPSPATRPLVATGATRPQPSPTPSRPAGTLQRAASPLPLAPPSASLESNGVGDEQPFAIELIGYFEAGSPTSDESRPQGEPRSSRPLGFESPQDRLAPIESASNRPGTAIVQPAPIITPLPSSRAVQSIAREPSWRGQSLLLGRPTPEAAPHKPSHPAPAEAHGNLAIPHHLPKPTPTQPDANGTRRAVRPARTPEPSQGVPAASQDGTGYRESTSVSSPNSQRIVVGLPGVALDASGEPIVTPWIKVGGPAPDRREGGSRSKNQDIAPADATRIPRLNSETSAHPIRFGGRVADGQDSTPEPLPLPEGVESGEWRSEDGSSEIEIWLDDNGNPIEPLFDTLIEEQVHDCGPRGCLGGNACGPLGRLRHLLRQPSYDVGMGHERVQTATLQIPASQPMNQVGITLDTAYGVAFPDRAGYFWPRSPGNALGQAETSVDYQRLRFRNELGGEKFSLTTDVPIWAIDPEQYPNTAGMGDMSLTTKTVLVDGRYLQLTQVFRTQMNTGAASHRLGIGSVAMEPGVLWRYKLSDISYLHGEVKYWFPVPGDPTFSGQVLEYGFGMSRVWWENDAAALIPTLEFVGYSLSDGFKTDPTLNAPVPVDSEHILNIFPGLRFSVDAGGDLGLFELGLGGGFSVTQDHFERGSLRVEVRWIY